MAAIDFQSAMNITPYFMNQILLVGMNNAQHNTSRCFQQLILMILWVRLCALVCCVLLCSFAGGSCEYRLCVARVLAESYLSRVIA